LGQVEGSGRLPYWSPDVAIVGDSTNATVYTPDGGNLAKIQLGQDLGAVRVVGDALFATGMFSTWSGPKKSWHTQQYNLQNGAPGKTCEFSVHG
jgi:hypothetical protein